VSHDHPPLRRRAATWQQALAALAVVLLMAGCAAEPKREPTPLPPPTSARPLPPQGAAGGVVTTPVAERPTYRGPWDDPSNPLFQRTVYFDYDSAEIKPEYISLMRTHGAYLGTNPSTKVTLEGHTDERGTREYNLALGYQRADAVRRFMTAEGVVPEQLTNLSYGEERPADPGHGESAWRQNRRVILQY